MLEELDIKNFALIDSAHVEFGSGFTVLSGETGAGKSILIGSLAFLLGGKAGLEQIRTGCHEAQITGVFLIKDNAGAREWLSEHGIEDEDDRIILRRVVKDTGKSSSWIGGTPVTRADLESFAAFLVDIHGQHAQQSLMKVADHRRYLDIYADIVQEVSDFGILYTDLVQKRKFLENLNENEAQILQKIDMLDFAVKEINEAKLKPHEDEELEAEESKLSSFEKLYSDMEEINSLFEGDENGGVVSLLKRLTGVSSGAVELDKELTSLDERLSSAFYELDDIAKEFRRYSSSLVFDPEHLAEIQDRLDFIGRLKKKYAGGINSSVNDVIEYGEKAADELEKLSGATEDKSELERQISELEKKVYMAAKAISTKRIAAAEKMSSAVEEILFRLGMKDAKFCVTIKEKEGNEIQQKCGPYGMDNIEFMISANPGSPVLPLAKIASGGELSRVMLALKTILSRGDMAETLIFDEIDTGIGGEIAVTLGEHMKKLADTKQILCITHLASIAVFAHHQIKIKKGVHDNNTSTDVFAIDGDERIKEVARMLSGDSVSQASLDHAASMLKKFGGM